MFQSIKQNKVDFKLYVLDSFLSLNEVSTINWSFKFAIGKTINGTNVLVGQLVPVFWVWC